MSDQSTGRIVPLTQGFFAVVDEEDFERVRQFRWHYNGGYARRAVKKAGGGQSKQWLHRFIMGEPPDREVDHRSLNKLDCRKQNLRICTQSENRWNTGPNRSNKSGFKGVSWSAGTLKWRAVIRSRGKTHHLGYFATKEGAASAYAAASQKMHAEFSRVSKPDFPEQRLTAEVPRPNYSHNTSGHHGVSWNSRERRWKAAVYSKNRPLHVGRFHTKEEAVLARKRAESIIPMLDPETLTGGMLRAAIAESVAS